VVGTALPRCCPDVEVRGVLALLPGRRPAMAGTSVLRSNRNFLRYWTANGISTLGSSMSTLAVPLLALALGGGAARAGLVGTCGMMIRLACRIPAGQLADQFNRRWIMLSADLVRMVLIGSIPLVAVLGRVAFEQLLGVAIVEGAVSALFSAAAGIAIRDVVTDDELVSAFGSNHAASSTVMLIGPLVGGILFGVQPMLPFVVDASSYLLSAVLLLGITVRPPETSWAAPDRRITAGLRWLGHQPGLLWVLAFVSMVNLAGSAVEVGIMITMRAQGESGSTIGAVLACVGAGAIIGAVVAPRLIDWLPPGVLFLWVGVTWMIGFCVLAMQPPVSVVCAVLTILMWFGPAAMIVLDKAVFVRCPRDILGRVNTAIGTGMVGLASLGPLLIGIAIENSGITNAWLLLAGITLLAIVLTGRPLLRSGLLVAEAVAPASDAVSEEAHAEPASDDASEPPANRLERCAEVLAHVDHGVDQAPFDPPGEGPR
jgi:MFS family permease